VESNYKGANLWNINQLARIGVVSVKRNGKLATVERAIFPGCAEQSKLIHNRGQIVLLNGCPPDHQNDGVMYPGLVIKLQVGDPNSS
jgi:hypothetical protein